jgi:hypothetical protein
MLTELSAEDLIARGIAPIKKEYLLDSITRTRAEAVGSSAAAAAGEEVRAKSKKQIRKVNGW